MEQTCLGSIARKTSSFLGQRHAMTLNKTSIQLPSHHSTAINQSINGEERLHSSSSFSITIFESRPFLTPWRIADDGKTTT
jgi:hypothetical protein